MATSQLSLSEVAHYGRQGVKFGGILLLLFIVGRFFFSYAAVIYRTLNPPPPPPATVGFGLLPLPSFPNQSLEDRPKQFVLETIGQRLTEYGSNQIPVYFMPSAQPSLIALDKAKAKAAALGFVFAPEKINNTLYRWRLTTPIPATLEIETVYGTLNLMVDWASSPDLLNKKMIPTPQSLATEVRTILRSVDLSYPDIATAEPKIAYIKALAGQQRTAASISEADFVQVDIFRATPNGLPSITHVKDHGVIRILFSGSRDQGERILSLSSYYQPIDTLTVETYPLQSANQAWQALQAGQGYVTNQGSGDQATVRSVYLAYYEPATPQNYYQPVYVFTGDNGFEALVPAIDPVWFASNVTP